MGFGDLSVGADLEISVKSVVNQPLKDLRSALQSERYTIPFEETKGVTKADISRVRSVIETTQKRLAMSDEKSQKKIQIFK